MSRKTRDVLSDGSGVDLFSLVEDVHNLGVALEGYSEASYEMQNWKRFVACDILEERDYEHTKSELYTSFFGEGGWVRRLVDAVLLHVSASLPVVLAEDVPYGELSGGESVLGEE